MGKIKVAHFICDLLRGGGQKSTIDLIRSSSDQVDNYLILLENKSAYEVEDLRVYSLCKNKKIYKKLDIFGDYLLAQKLKKLLTELEVDIVISHMEVTAKVLRFIDLVPKVFYIRTDVTQELDILKQKSYFRYRKKSYIYKRMLRNQNIVTISQDSASKLLQFISPKKIETIYNPFDQVKINTLSNENIQLPEDEYLVQIGKGISVKRQDILLEAFSKIKDKQIKLLLLGTEENKETMELLEKFNIPKNRIIFQAFTLNPYPFIKHAKMLVVSSEREGLPRVIVESLILKTPVVSTDCDTGPREVLTGELSKFLANVNDPESLAEKIHNGLEYYPNITDINIKKFDKEEISKKFLLYVRSVLST